MFLIHVLCEGMGFSAKHLFSFCILPKQMAYYGEQSRRL